MELVQELEPSKVYVRGFNAGYLLAEDGPELVESLLKGNKSPSSDYMKGMRGGWKEMELEKVRNAESARDNSNDREAERRR